MSKFTQDQINEAVKNALHEAKIAQQKYLQDVLGGTDKYTCGFAWVVVKIHGGSKLAKQLKVAGFDKHWGGGLDYWGPGSIGVQNIDCNLEGAKVFAKILTNELGVEFYAQSRVD